MINFAPSPREHLNGKRMYRFMDCSWADDGKSMEMIWYVVRETPKGYWITDEYAIQEKFVLKSGKKRFAYPTREEAFASYMKRKEKQVTILSAQLANARKRLVYGITYGIPDVPVTNIADQSGDFDF